MAKTIGKRISEIRKSQGLKQIDFAKILNVSQQVVSNIERDKTMPDIGQLEKIADLFDISLDQLVGRELSNIELDEVEQQIISCVKRMNEYDKKLSLGLLNQVAKHRGNNEES